MSPRGVVNSRASEPYEAPSQPPATRSRSQQAAAAQGPLEDRSAEDANGALPDTGKTEGPEATGAPVCDASAAVWPSIPLLAASTAHLDEGASSAMQHMLGRPSMHGGMPLGGHSVHPLGGRMTQSDFNHAAFAAGLLTDYGCAPLLLKALLRRTVCARYSHSPPFPLLPAHCLFDFPVLIRLAPLPSLPLRSQGWRGGAGGLREDRRPGRVLSEQLLRFLLGFHPARWDAARALARRPLPPGLCGVKHRSAVRSVEEEARGRPVRPLRRGMGIYI